MTWDQIPGYFDFQDIYSEAVASAPEGGVLVEVGTLWGRSAVYMAERIKESGKNLKFYVVDRWRPYVEQGFDVAGNFPEIIKQHGSMFGGFAYYIESSGLSEYIRVLRMDSSEAAKLFLDLPPHFVFIDANHEYENCLRDIQSWDPYMPKGSVIAGHDYDWESVKRAVDDHFGDDVAEARVRSWIVRK